MDKITTISENGLNLIKQFEGFESNAYLCPAKVWTIGYGATYWMDGQKVKQGETITESAASAMLAHHLHAYEKAVDTYTRDDINQGQFDALVSFAYNLGINALKGSTLLKKVNINPNDKTIEKEFLKWVNAGGRKLDGLVRRRQAEANLYFS